MIPHRPTFASRDEYAARLGDARYWSPYIEEIVRRHRLSDALLAVGTVGSFPTFLVGSYVVKLFCEQFDGAVCFQSERAILQLLRAHPAIPAPELIAEGALFGVVPQSVEATPAGADWPWPYLIITRVGGVAWHDGRLAYGESAVVAREIGTVLRQLHGLPPPIGPLWERDWLAEFRATCLERQRGYGTLPPDLLDQVEAYLIEPQPDRRLLHADLHDHHLFLEKGRLAGIIDWGDTIVADPYHELPALHLGTFKADTRLLAAFLDGYAWPAAADFERRAMSATIAHPFDVLRRVARATDLSQFDSLEALAAHIWRTS